MSCYDNLRYLSNQEILSLTLRERPDSPVTKNLDSLMVCPEQLVNSTVEEIMAIPGVGKKKAMQLKASVELGRRLYQSQIQELTLIKGPAEVADLMQPQMRYLDREHFKAILLNRKNHVLSIETISIGTLTSSLVHPREVFKPAIKRSAASIILVHNHPSGDPQPSAEDISITKRLCECGQLMGIEVLDHIIIGEGCWHSLKSSGLF